MANPLEDGNHDVRSTLSDVVSIIDSQVRLLKDKALTQRQPLSVEDARLLGSFAKSLCSISCEERHQANVNSSELGQLADDDLEALAAQADQVLFTPAAPKKPAKKR